LWGGSNALTHSGELRVDNDLKQEAVARFLNIRQETYSRYETEKRATPIDILIKLAGYYKTSVDYLLGITDEKIAYKSSKSACSRAIRIKQDTTPNTLIARWTLKALINLHIYIAMLMKG